MRIILNADTEMKRIKGLMHHSPLEKDECAFFDAQREGKHSFWNKNVDFPISLIFCDANNKVVDIKYLEAQQTQSVSSESYNAKYIIEAHKDAPKLYGINSGSVMVKQHDEVLFQ